MLYYKLNYKGKTSVLERMVEVKKKMITVNNLDIVLNGEEKLYLLKGTSYNEPGATVYCKIDNSVFEEGNLKIDSNVDTNKQGEYEVTYTLKYDNGSIVKTRRVIVFDVAYSINPDSLTSKEVKIKLDFNNISDYLNVKLPNNEVSSNKVVEYKVNKNGEFTFVINLLNNQVISKVIEVSNIIDNYVCSGEITSTGTRLSVIPSSSLVKEYKWITNNETVNGTSIYSKNKVINNASVQLKFANNKTYTVNCKIEDKLIYHFKYDEDNTKPFMRSDTYTSSDKIKYDAMLKKVVNEAGYGTRAGVVAAARFIVGALDYKVPYQGASYYNKEGLNIGQNGAWGSSGNGLDCYSFVVWARMQNGLPDDSLYSGKTYKTYDEANSIRVGDYLLTPCSGTCKNPFKINHIGLVIGVDNNYIYVAEAKTVSINALVVTKLDKKDLPKRYALSLVKHVNYSSEGNVTDMWIS